MNWARENVVVLLTLALLAWLGYAIVRAFLNTPRGDRRPAPDDGARAAQVRAEIERAKAERKANPLPPLLPAEARMTKPGAKGPRGLRPLPPFGGPTRRLWHRARDWLRGKRSANARG